MAGQWKLMWWRFRRHRPAVVSAVFLALMYFSTADQRVHRALRPAHAARRRYIFAPPQAVHVIHEGQFLGPFVYGLKMDARHGDPAARLHQDTAKPQQLRFFCLRRAYEFWGLIDGQLPLRLPGRGRQLLPGSAPTGSAATCSAASSMPRASRSPSASSASRSPSRSRSILGGLAGYYGGWVDKVVQRITEILKSFPHLPLWLALSAALPVTWSPLLVYFGITLILALLDWPSLGRAVRSKLLSLREEDYAMAAQMMGAKPGRIIGRHLLPGFMSHLIASATLSIPSMILAETACSFLGLGLRPPITSWGVLLNEATDINVVAVNWWLMLPVVPVILVILAYQFMGDGMRDAADPYA